MRVSNPRGRPRESWFCRCFLLRPRSRRVIFHPVKWQSLITSDPLSACPQPASWETATRRRRSPTSSRHSLSAVPSWMRVGMLTSVLVWRPGALDRCPCPFGAPCPLLTTALAHVQDVKCRGELSSDLAVRALSDFARAAGVEADRKRVETAVHDVAGPTGKVRRCHSGLVWAFSA